MTAKPRHDRWRIGKAAFLKKASSSAHRHSDLEYIHKELAKNGLTLKLLWSEYCEQSRLSNELPLMYSQFYYHYQKYAETQRATMHMKRKPGEQIEVDWAGQTASIDDRDTREIIPVYVFVAALSSSQYAYVEAFTSQNQES
jgi:transposase